ncbi:MAG: right-handed parallel beta-helix repeat-containing protein [Phycisphaerae bacterium]|nr:right-handed parallel beta-helix repeat-containing protein [Phycisphaerae bacterium]
MRCKIFTFLCATAVVFLSAANVTTAANYTQLARMGQTWLLSSGDAGYDQTCDYNLDDFVNLKDFAILAYIWETDGKVYFVSESTGVDTNPGTSGQPFKTIQKAASLMVAGDACFIRQGVYREMVTPANSGTEKNPILFLAYPNEHPIISGADLLTGPWSVYSGSIYKTTISTPSEDAPFNQLFVDHQMYNEARWPNTGVNQLVTMNRAYSDAGTDGSILVDDALPPGDWNDATVHIVPGDEWISFTKFITNYTPGASFSFSDNAWGGEYYTPEVGDPYWLFGALDGLDIATEWYLKKADVQSYDCYLWCEGNDSPSNHIVEVKKRNHAFDLSSKSHIRVKGMRIFAAAVLMDGSHNCLIENCHIKYVDHFSQCSSYSTSHNPYKHQNRMSGSDNEWKKCSIVYSAGNGIHDRGQGNKVTNCIIHDVDYIATYAGAIYVNPDANGGLYTRNTLYDSGRFVFWHEGRGFVCSYNHMYHGPWLTKDCGITYSWGCDGGGAIICYNNVHDTVTSIYPRGIYVDNNCANLTIHHNLVWNIPETGINMSCPINNVHSFNNTILASCGKAFGYGYWEAPADQSTCSVINNLYKCSIGNFAPIPPELHHNGNYEINPDGTLTSSSVAIDGGYVIPGITDGYVGDAPDVGCYEYGAEFWTAGADWQEPVW